MGRGPEIPQRAAPFAGRRAAARSVEWWPSVTDHRPRRVLVAFVDALGPAQAELLSPALGDLRERRALRGILGYSCAALPTLLTGRPPRVHGRMCTFRRAGEDGILAPLRWLGLLPRLVHERAFVRRAAAKLIARHAGSTGYLDLYRIPPRELGWLDVAEREDLFAASEIGGATSFLHRAREAGVSVDVTPWQLPEEARFAAAVARARTAPATLTFAYATELDGVMHGAGPSSRRAEEAGRRVSERIAELRDVLARGADLTTVVVGDHGMAEVGRTVDPRPVVRGIPGLRYFVDSTFLRLWGAPRALRAVAARFEGEGVPGRFLDADALTLRDAPVDGAPYGEAMVVLDEGAVFAPSFVGGVPRGMHGYDLDAGSSQAALLSDGALSESCRSLEDVAGAILGALGLPASRGGVS